MKPDILINLMIPMTNPIKLTIRERIQETPDTITLRFEETFDELPYKSGQFLTVMVSIDQEEYRREYSFSSSPQTDKNLSICVKRVTGGKVSNYLHDVVKTGDILNVFPAAGLFSPILNISNKRTLVFIAGGSGITPIFSMIKSVLAIEQQSKVYLLYANRTENDIIFKSTFESLQTTFSGRFNHLNVLSQASEKWYGLTGRLDQDTIIDYLEQLPVIFPKEANYYICAPTGLIKAAQQALTILKVPAANIHKENFGSSNNQEINPTNTGNEIIDRTVKVKYKGIIHSIFVASGKSILKSALEENIRLPFSCEKGVCTACLGTCKTGKVEMKGNDALSQNELDKGYILTCIGKPVSDDVFIDLD